MDDLFYYPLCPRCLLSEKCTSLPFHDECKSEIKISAGNKLICYKLPTRAVRIIVSQTNCKFNKIFGEKHAYLKPIEGFNLSNDR